MEIMGVSNPSKKRSQKEHSKNLQLGDFEKIYETINENRPLIEMKIS
jgi:hypothetical protein